MTKASEQPGPEKKPRYWDKRVAAAYLRIMGATQAGAGASVGRAEDTIGRWERHPSWPRARAEASDRWMADATDGARQSVLAGVKANAELGFRFLERVDPRLAPPGQKLDVTSGGKAIPSAIQVTLVKPDVQD